MEGITFINAVMGELLPLTALNKGRFPVPEAAKPIAGLELVQVHTAPVGLTEKTVDPTSPPHIVISDIKLIVATGGTVTVIPALVSVSVQAAVELTIQVKTEPPANEEEEYV